MTDLRQLADDVCGKLGIETVYVCQEPRAPNRLRLHPPTETYLDAYEISLGVELWEDLRGNRASSGAFDLVFEKLAERDATVKLHHGAKITWLDGQPRLTEWEYGSDYKEAVCRAVLEMETA